MEPSTPTRTTVNATTTTPPAPAFFIQRGIAFRDRYDYHAAIELYTQALSLDPRLIKGYIHRGYAYLRVNQLAHAMQDFNRAIELNDKDTEAFYYRGLAYLKQDLIQPAICDFACAITHEPDSARGYLGLGIARARSPELRAHAAEALDTAARLFATKTASDPREPWWLLHRAQALRCLALLPPGASLLGKLKWPKTRARFLADAHAEVEKSLSLRAGFVEALVERGLIRVASGAIPDALQDFATAVAADSLRRATIIDELRVMRGIVAADDSISALVTTTLDRLSDQHTELIDMDTALRQEHESRNELQQSLQDLRQQVADANVRIQALEQQNQQLLTVRAGADEAAANAKAEAVAAEQQLAALRQQFNLQLQEHERRLAELLAQAEQYQAERDALSQQLLVASQQLRAQAPSLLTQSMVLTEIIEPRWKIPPDQLVIAEGPGSRLGAGSLGEVRRAIWNNSTPVATKELFMMRTDPAAVQDMGGYLDTRSRAGALREFLNEYAINSSIRHPNIVMFLGVGVDADDKPRFLVLELMERGSLHDEIYPRGIVPRQGAPMVLGRIVSILLDVSRALVYLHSRTPPVLHLDLKPKNVLIDVSGRAKIGDLGESHEIRSRGQDRTKGLFGVGTPIYMAPEMEVEGTFKGPAADMFMLGVMACEMSSGHPPSPGFKLTNVNGVCHTIPEPSRRASDIAAMKHPEIRTLVDQLILDDPQQRWDAKEVQSFLARLQHPV